MSHGLFRQALCGNRYAIGNSILAKPHFARSFHQSVAWTRLFVKKDVYTSTGPLDSSMQTVERGASTVRRGLTTLGIAVGLVFGMAYLDDSRAAVYSHVVMPVLRLCDAEDTHVWSIQLAKMGLSPRDTSQDTSHPNLTVNLFGKTLHNPVGLAAGYDKHGEAVDAMFNLGFGMVEVGSVTPLPQPGNPRPRLFRLPQERACINRYGFNSEGHDTVYQRLVDRFWRRTVKNQSIDETQPVSNVEQTYRSGIPGRLLGINLGKNTASSADSYEDYVQGVHKFGSLADYLVINVSCPNTPGQVEQQKRGQLVSLLKEVVQARDQLEGHRPPVVVKISPDLLPSELREIADAVLTARVDGIILTNTTAQRPQGLKEDTSLVHQKGGLSGPPLADLSLRTLREMYRLTQGKVPLIGCGGIRSGEDALKFARAGASVVQLYTGMAFEGPGLPRRIKDELVELLDGRPWSEIVGTDVHQE
ncbi:dihydroorotate dehydrogenase [Dispira simplex]|nr:dihydroorotate dehydrogenase [Dispira simplex]